MDKTAMEMLSKFGWRQYVLLALLASQAGTHAAHISVLHRGKGLGKAEDGISKPITVSPKQNTDGVRPNTQREHTSTPSRPILIVPLRGPDRLAKAPMGRQLVGPCLQLCRLQDRRLAERRSRRGRAAAERLVHAARSLQHRQPGASGRQLQQRPLVRPLRQGQAHALHVDRWRHRDRGVLLLVRDITRTHTRIHTLSDSTTSITDRWTFGPSSSSVRPKRKR